MYFYKFISFFKDMISPSYNNYLKNLEQQKKISIYYNNEIENKLMNKYNINQKKNILLSGGSKNKNLLSNNFDNINLIFFKNFFHSIINYIMTILSIIFILYLIITFYNNFFLIIDFFYELIYLFIYFFILVIYYINNLIIIFIILIFKNLYLYYILLFLILFVFNFSLCILIFSFFFSYLFISGILVIF